MHPFRISSYFDILNKTKKMYNHQLEPVCKKWDLTRSEVDVLLFLYNNPQYDRAVDIVTHRGMTKSHVSLSVTSLEERRFLERQFSAEDRRMAHLRLTEAGAGIAGEAKLAQKTFIDNLYAGISEEEMAFMEALTQKVVKNIENFDK